MLPGQSLIVVHALPLFGPPAHTLGSTFPASSFIVPQVPAPIVVVN